MLRINHIAAMAAAVSMLVCVDAAAQRETGLPDNYPSDGKTPSWFKKCPDKPLVSYSAKTWGMLPDETVGTINVDADTRNAYSVSKNSKGLVTKMYVIDGFVYMVKDENKTVMKIPSDIGGNAASFNKSVGAEALKSTKTEVIARDLCNYKNRLVEHRTIKQTNVLANGQEEVGITEDWIDCEYGISLRHTEAQYGSIPSETYDIVIGPQPKSVFTLPEGYKVIDISAVAASLGMGSIVDAIMKK